MGDWSQLIKSKRFWVVVAGIAFVLLKDKFPGIKEDDLLYVIMTVVSFVIGESLNSSERSSATRLTDMLKDPRFVAALSAIAVVFLKSRFPNITEETIQKLMLLINGWILAESYRPSSRHLMDQQEETHGENQSQSAASS